MKKYWLKCIVVAVVVAFLVYNSVYFKKLDEKTNSANVTTVTELNPAAFARSFWNNAFKKAIDSAITMEAFEKEFIEKGALVTLEKYSHGPGISDVAYMLQNISGRVKEITADKMILSLSNSRANHIDCNMGNYFGNGVRDVTGLIKMGDFTNSLDYNLVSSELNKIVKNDVILPVKNKIKVNDRVTVVACVEVDNQRLNDEVLPVKITVNN